MPTGWGECVYLVTDAHKVTRGFASKCLAPNPEYVYVYPVIKVCLRASNCMVTTSDKALLRNAKVLPLRVGRWQAGVLIPQNVALGDAREPNSAWKETGSSLLQVSGTWNAKVSERKGATRKGTWG